MTHSMWSRERRVDAVAAMLVVMMCTGLGNAFAQTSRGAVDIPPPPRLSDKPTSADDEDATSVTIRQEGENKIEEFRARGGKVYAVRVTPKIGKPYMLFDPDRRQETITSGGFPPSELDEGIRPAQWTLFEF